MDVVGRRIATARRGANLSVEQLAEMIGKSVHTVRAYEIGRTTASVEVLRRVADATGRTTQWLLDGDAGQPDNDLTDILQRTERQLEAIRKQLAERDAAELHEIPITRWVTIPIIGIAPGGRMGGGGGDD